MAMPRGCSVADPWRQSPLHSSASLQQKRGPRAQIPKVCLGVWQRHLGGAIFGAMIVFQNWASSRGASAVECRLAF